MDRSSRRGGGFFTLILSHLFHSVFVSSTSMTADSEILVIEGKLTYYCTFSMVNVHFPGGVLSTNSLDFILTSNYRDMLIAGDLNSHSIILNDFK